MNVLSIETATQVASAALLREKHLLGEFFLNIKKNHSEKLLPMIHQLLQDAEMPSKEIDLVAVSIGPGSFTGLRIGMATAKGLSYGWGVPLIGVGTLDAMAFSQRTYPKAVVPLINARRQEAYGAIFLEGVRKTDYFVWPVAVLLDKLKEMGQLAPLFLGDGAQVLSIELQEALPEARFVGAGSIDNRAGHVGFLALEEYAQRKEDSLADLAPFYVRDSQAEQNLKRKMNHE